MTRQLTFHLIPHTHWDREWYLPRAAFLARLVPATEAILGLLEADDDARFVGDGQTVLFEDVRDVQPSFGNRIRDAVRRRQLEVGPWHVLADELIPSGESLVRNLLAGGADAMTAGGLMKVCYSPDAFGHPAALPAVAKEFGIDSGVVWRGLAPDERGDVDLRLWRSPDGSEMLLYHLPRDGYEIGSSLPGHDVISQWNVIRPGLVARAVTSHVAVFVGADHHAPPASLAAMRDQIGAAESGHVVRISSLTEYFDAVRPHRGSLGAVAGELRSSYGHAWTLQGVHGTRPRMKRRHSATELVMLRQAEPLVALASLASDPAAASRAAVIRHAWRALLQSQFHDTIAGTVIDAVAREQDVRLSAVDAFAAELCTSALHALTGHDPDAARDPGASPVPTICLWNPAPRKRGGIVLADVTVFREDIIVGPPGGRVARSGPGFQPFALGTSDGTPIPVQVISLERGSERLDAPRHYPDQDEVDRVRVAFEAPTIAGFGFDAFTTGASSALPAERGLVASGHRLENAFVSVTVTDDGRITIHDRRTGEVYRDLLGLEDECDCGDTYTPYIRPEIATARDCEPMSLAVRGGPLVSAIDVGWRMRSAGSGDLLCHLEVSLHADSPVVRLRYRIDNCAVNHRLRARLPVGAGDAAITGAAFTTESRRAALAVGHDNAAEAVVTTAPAHRFVAAGAASRGLVVMQPGFFEYEWTPNADLFITMLRSVGELSRGSMPTRPGHAAWPVPVPEAQEAGWHSIDMAVVPADHGDLVRPELLERIWAEVFVPIRGVFMRAFVGDMSVASELGIELRGEGLVFSALKVADDGAGIVLRCYNVSDREVAGEWQVSVAGARAFEARLDESVKAQLDIGADGIVAITVPPHAIATVRILPVDQHPGG